METQKTCTTCNQQKCLSEFHKSRSGRYGVASVCKECVVVYHKQHYLANKTNILRQTSKYQTENRDRLREVKKNWEKRNRKSIRLAKKKYEQENRKVKQAHAKVLRAKKKGTLIPMPCVVCGGPNAQAHHDDYSKPLSVKWYCSLHHNQMHAKERSTNGTASIPTEAAAPEASAPAF
jgi:hypothetical protein